MAETTALVAFHVEEARTATAIFERMFPADDSGPGAKEIGVVAYLDRALAGAYRDQVETYRLGLAALDRAARLQCGAAFADCTPAQQDQLLALLERGELADFAVPSQPEFFALLGQHLREGLFADPAYGGNREKQGWRWMGHPGVWLENSAEENQATRPVTKGGVVKSLADVGLTLGALYQAPGVPGFEPQAGSRPPAGPVDVLMVGLGGMGGMVAPVLAKAGLRVLALEAGPWRPQGEFIPDELGVAYYCRANMGDVKYNRETPRWRRNEGEPTQEATFSLGRMVNGVGGSILHYGSWLRRFHPHHFRQRSHVLDRWGSRALPEGTTLADWPLTYAELEPYYTRIEHLVGVSGDEGNPFVQRSRPLPNPPLRDFTQGELFKRATRGMGLHPYPVPVGMNSQPYDGRPGTTYTAWSNGLGPTDGSRWHPGQTTVPEALATGNFALKTHCRVLRVTTDSDGRASGVEYVDARGQVQFQPARTVILCSYTQENIRLMLLSGDSKHPNGLGNNSGQVGKHFMTKMFAHVLGYIPDMVMNRHTGPAAQGVILDDFVSEGFDSFAHGFIGGSTLGAENQALPLQNSQEATPPGLSTWGRSYKQHLRDWNHWAIVRIQSDALPYQNNFVDLDPHYRDRSGLGLPLLRFTYDLRPNEHRLSEFVESRCAEILRAMGANRVWPGPRFTGVGSSHELGGCRMGEDPVTSVVDRDLRVHDTPGLYVFSGAAAATCPGINPTLTLWAYCLRAAEQLVERLKEGEER